MKLLPLLNYYLFQLNHTRQIDRQIDRQTDRQSQSARERQNKERERKTGQGQRAEQRQKWKSPSRLHNKKTRHGFQRRTPTPHQCWDPIVCAVLAPSKSCLQHQILGNIQMLNEFMSVFQLSSSLIHSACMIRILKRLIGLQVSVHHRQEHQSCQRFTTPGNTFALSRFQTVSLNQVYFHRLLT